MTCPTTNPTHKRGDTFDRSGQITINVDGVHVPDLTGWAGAAQVRTRSGALIAAITFTWLDATQSLARIRAADTTGWPVGPAEIDIQLTSPAGDVVSTDTERLDIVSDVTRP